jgi:two-component system response regulator NreC
LEGDDSVRIQGIHLAGGGEVLSDRTEPGAAVVIADDGVLSPSLRAAVESEARLNLVRDASCVDELLAAVRECEPETAVVGFRRRNDALRAVTAITEICAATRVIAVVPGENAQVAGALLHAGASAVVRDTDRVSELLAALAASEGAGGAGGADEVADSVAVRLTSRETQVLELLGLGHTNAEIAELLNLSIRTVQAHRAHLQYKLGTRTRAGLFQAAIARGLVFPNLPQA